MNQRCAGGDAAAQTDDAHAAGLRMQQQRQMAQKLLREHVSAVRRVHLALDCQGECSGEPSHRNRRGCTLFVVKQFPRLQARCEIQIEIADVGAVLVAAAGEQIQVPPWRQHNQRGGSQHAGKASAALPCRQATGDEGETGSADGQESGQP